MAEAKELPTTIFAKYEPDGKNDPFLMAYEEQADATNEDESPTTVGEYKLVATRKLRRKTVTEEL